LKPELLVAQDVAAAAADRIFALGPRSVALAGGTTPRRLYEGLAERRVPWEQTDVFFGDERCVPPNHPASNFGMAYRALLSKVPARVYRMPSETCDPSSYERDLAQVLGPGIPRFDLVLLGLGEDGHTVSLFPGDPALEERERLVVRVVRPDYPRLTLTLPVLSAARVVIFLVSGRLKRAALRCLMDGDDTIPAARVNAETVVVIADEAAAGERVRG
jgi:6-phosphogluconolactonase